MKSCKQRIIQKAHGLDPVGLLTVDRVLTIYTRFPEGPQRKAFSRRILRILATPSASHDRTQTRIERAIARMEAAGCEGRP